MPFFNIFSKKQPSPEKKLKIIVDNREKNSLVIPELLNQNFEIEYKQLPVADYLINNIAIERKTIQDLKSSIINKRIMQQLLELKQYPSHLLLIEGFSDENIYAPPLHENAIRGFLLSIALEFQTPMIFTQNAKDTVKYFSIIAKKKPSSEPSLRPSKIFLSENEQAQFILEGFPGIGPKTAQLLLEKFKTIKNIINAPEEEIKSLLGKKANNFLNFENNYHLTRGEPLLAIREFSNLAKGYPNLEKIRFFLGLACYKAGNFAEALKDFEHVYKLNPNYRNVAQWVEFLRDDRVYHEGAAFCRSREEFLNYSYGHIATEKPASVSLNA